MTQANADILLGLGRLERLAALPGRLDAAADVSELFRRAAQLALAECGYTRAVILTIDRGTLTAETTDPPADHPSDRLRRTVQRSPLAITPGTAEADAVRQGRSQPGSQSLLAEQLGLTHYAFARIAVQGSALALLVVDREQPAIDALDYAVLSAFAVVVSSVLQTMLMRARLNEVSAELRHLAVSSQALVGEVQHAPPELPYRHGDRLSFGTFEGVPIATTAVTATLTDRERVIAGLLAEGLSNRKIAERLVISPETVKAHVARILRKLGAANRVEAVARYLQARTD
jgi:DNA-binding NarL/FixJ family response regulator